jgi:hypothetical protein
VRNGGGKGGNVRRWIWNGVVAMSLGIFVATGVLWGTSGWWTWGFSSGVHGGLGFRVVAFMDGVWIYVDPDRDGNHALVGGAGLGHGNGGRSGDELLHELEYGNRPHWGFRLGTDLLDDDGFVLIPYWFLLAVSAILPSIWLMKRRKAQPECCKNCGYDLRASPVRCPECGRERIG